MSRDKRIIFQAVFRLKKNINGLVIALCDNPFIYSIRKQQFFVRINFDKKKWASSWRDDGVHWMVLVEFVQVFFNFHGRTTFECWKHENHQVLVEQHQDHSFHYTYFGGVKKWKCWLLVLVKNIEEIHISWILVSLILFERI